MDQSSISGKAVIITGGLFDSNNAKTAHGLIRYTNRFEIIGVIDDVSAGKDAGEIVDSSPNNVPVVATISEFIEKYEKPDFAIIGMATKGGVLPKALYPSIEEILDKKVRIVNGLHEPLSEIEEFQKILDGDQSRIVDIRRSKPFRELHFWTGKIKEISSKKIAVLGTDCALGKRTTSTLLQDALMAQGIKSEMIYTGQTGWMQGYDYGFLFDATANDFIPGELEHAMYTCWKDKNPEVMIIEGQSGLRNPSGPCGSEFIISGAADGVILQHSPVREKFKGLENYPAKIPDILDEIELIEKMGSPVIGITVNTSGMSKEDADAYKAKLAKSTNIAIVAPFFEPLDGIVKALEELKK